MTEGVAWSVNALNPSAATQRKQVCPVCSYRGCLFLRSCKDFAFSLNICGVKPAVGDSSAPQWKSVSFAGQQ